MSEEEISQKKTKTKNFFGLQNSGESAEQKPEKHKKRDRDPKSIPEQLKKFVSEEVWNLWSDARRDSYSEMFDNPNKFFYRNRPPGEPQKNGGWSDDEEQQFLERLSYFQDELGISDSCWGLFAVPITGRLGYQCSNFYRSLIKEGKIITDRYSVIEGKLVCNKSVKSSKPSPEVLEELNKEAREYIDKVMKSFNDEVPTMDKPTKVFSKNRKSDRTPPPQKVETSSSDSESVNIEKLSALFGRSRNIPDRRYNIMEDHLATQNMRKSSEIAKKKKIFTKENTCPIVGYLDPLTEMPIKTPMMDPSGFVMDLDSWRYVFDKMADPPSPIAAESEKDLVELNQSNFENYRLQIVNIPC